MAPGRRPQSDARVAGMKDEIPEMLKRGGGAIVNNGSVVGLVGSPLIVGSVATKHGVSGLTKTAALEYATQGIRVNAVAPGLVRTMLAERMVRRSRRGPKRQSCPWRHRTDGAHRRRLRRSSSSSVRMQPPTSRVTSCRLTVVKPHADSQISEPRQPACS